jgi:hypothetical protein
MGRLARFGWIAVLSSACAVGGPPSDPFGSGVTGDAEDDDGEEVSTTNDTDPLSTISETLESSATLGTTSGVVPETGSSGSSGGESGEATSSSTGEGSSSSSGEGSSSTGEEEVAMCASSNTLDSCPVAGSSSMPFTEDMLCTTDMAFMNPEVYDFFVVDVSAGSCVSVTVDNEGGDADVMAYVVDANEAYYGLEPDYSELDDEIPCSTTPWNGFACPSAGVSAAAAGSITIAVGQWDTEPDCTDNAPYTLWVAIDGEDIDMSDALVLDDYVVDPLACP